MLLGWHHLSPCLMLLWLCTTNALCPLQCACRLTERGKRKVTCTKGNLKDGIPVDEMDNGVEVLEISAPSPETNSVVITSIFQKFKKLEELNVKHSNVTQIGQHAFWGVPSLRKLDLSENLIVALYDHNFRGLVNLIELNLNDNRIKDVQSAVFKHLTELRLLTLERNNLIELSPRIFFKLAKLHVLKISGNQFDELNPEVFKDIPELRVLECRACGLRRINPQIYHLLPYLAHLDLGDNRLQFLDDEEFVDLRRLHSLKLDGNQLPVVLEGTFGNQRQLKYLTLARNRLAKLTDTAFINMSSLVDLDISHNKLDRIEGTVLLHVADTLQKLVITGNPFGVDVVRTVLQAAYKVWHLEMADLALGVIPETLLPARLKYVNLAGNNLTNLTVAHLPRHLEGIDLSRNSFKSLDERVLFKLEHLRHVNLSLNPWACDSCHGTALVLRANRSVWYANLTCATPNTLKGQLIFSLKLEDLGSCETDVKNSDNFFGLAIGVGAVTLFLVACVVFLVWSCRKRTRRDRTEGPLPMAHFSKDDINFKFPLDLTERKMSVSTIDEIKRDTQNKVLPNGTGI